MYSSSEASPRCSSSGTRVYVEIGRLRLEEDAPIWNTIHFKPGTLTRFGAALSRYLEDLRRYPRAHPRAELIA